MEPYTVTLRCHSCGLSERVIKWGQTWVVCQHCFAPNEFDDDPLPDPEDPDPEDWDIALYSAVER